jgi:hypothetical protein
LVQFASIKLGKLGGHFLTTGIKRGISGIPCAVKVFEVTKVIQFAGQFAKQVNSAAEKGFVQSEQSFTSGHGFPPLKLRIPMKLRRIRVRSQQIL